MAAADPGPAADSCSISVTCSAITSADTGASKASSEPAAVQAALRLRQEHRELRQYDTLLCPGWRAVDRLRRQAPKGAVRPSVIVVFVCQPGTLESFMRVADTELTGTLGFYRNPGTQLRPGREALIFCEVDDTLLGNMRAFRLPSLPPAGRKGGGLDPREVALPGYRASAPPSEAAIEWAF
jgi:hypothetical protein